MSTWSGPAGGVLRMTDFTRVMLTDKLAWDLFGLAGRERMLYSASTEQLPPSPRRGTRSANERRCRFLCCSTR